MDTTPWVNVVTATLVSLALIAAVAFLTWHGDISGEAAIAFFAAVIGGAGAAGIGHVATKTGAEAALSVPQAPRPPGWVPGPPPPQ